MIQINFTPDELQLVINGLAELPAKLSYNLIQKLQIVVHKAKDNSTDEGVNHSSNKIKEGE